MEFNNYLYSDAKITHATTETAAYIARSHLPNERFRQEVEPYAWPIRAANRSVSLAESKVFLCLSERSTSFYAASLNVVGTVYIRY